MNAVQKKKGEKKGKTGSTVILGGVKKQGGGERKGHSTGSAENVCTCGPIDCVLETPVL